MGMPSDILNGIALWITRKERKQDRDDDTVRSVLTAVNTTKLYIAHLENGEPLNRETEAELVELWMSAAVSIRRTDPDLAAWLQDKAVYWTNPREWSPEEVVNSGIHIDKIAAEGARLLGDV